jgi:hypothetical protein
MSAKEAGQAFLDSLLAHVPAEQQAGVRAAFEANEAALNELGAGTLRQSDYSRSKDEVAAYKGQLDTWFTENQARLNAAATAPATPQTPSPIQSPTSTTPFTREDYLKDVQVREQAALQAIVTTNQLTAKHYATFQEVLDIPALMKDPQINEIGLLGVYDKHYKPKLDVLAQAAEDKRIQGLVDARLVEERKRFTQMPYPVNGREPSPLDAIEKALANPPDPTKPVQAPVGSVDVVDLAVQQYNAAQAASMGAPTI